MGNQILFSKDATKSIKSGVDTLVNAVKVTLGPKGRNVIIDRKDLPPVSTKDGVSVAENINLDDVLENVGAKMVKEVAGKSLLLAGDGTTTASVLIQSLIEGIEQLPSNINIYDVKEGMEAALRYVQEDLEEQAQKITVEDIEEMTNIATISANNDSKVGKLIAECFNKVGANGRVEFIKKGESLDYTVDYGMYYENNHSFDADYEKYLISTSNDPYILLIDGTLETADVYMKILDITLKNSRPLIIITNAVTPDVITNVKANMEVGNKVYLTLSPGHGKVSSEYLYDISVATGGRVFSVADLKDFKEEDFGEAKSVRIGANFFEIKGAKGPQDQINAQIDNLKEMIENAEDSYALEIYQDRLAKVDGGVATINVGAATETEKSELYDRVDDAVKAVRCALDEGIVVGGGVALLNCTYGLNHRVVQEDNKNYSRGLTLISDALSAPLYEMLINASITKKNSVDIIAEILCEDKNLDFGYDVKNNKFVDLKTSGILDPKRVTRTAIENAVSMATMYLLTDCAIYSN